MGQQQPQCIITDQCPGIKKACPNVFKHSVHKYCMWHIMQKMPEKVGRAICNDTEFMTDINVVVWDVDLEPKEFEQNWQTVIEAHGMQSNRWLKYVFVIRQKWILAYFRDLPLEQQRHSQRRMDTANEHNMLEKVGPMKNGRQVHRIPEPYVLARWTKKSYRPIAQDENGKVIEDIDEADIKKAEMSKFRENITGPIQPKTKNQEIDDLLGITASNDIDLRPPNKAKNKGSGKRLRSSKEKAKSKPEKRKRRCGNCKKWVNHNSRTYNLPFAESPPSDDDDEEEAETEEI
ncbi:uncharacterized protein LOC141588297 [Silene latifolia]|uniref:uncharacterized protein LOC141588297 n=1 Tax=Silene latifolia TaxID=37657 RepID=UPI003D76EEC7